MEAESLDRSSVVHLKHRKTGKVGANEETSSLFCNWVL